MGKEQFLYKQIYDDLKKKIDSGELKEDTSLPSGKELAGMYNASAITITKALNTLRDEGYLNRVKGKGSFVRIPARGSAGDGEVIRKGDEREQAQNKHQKLIGLVLEHVSSCFGLDMMYAMDMIVEQAGYKLCTRFSYGDREKETEEINFLKQIGVEGIVVMPGHGQYYNTAILKLVLEGFPVVLIDKKMDGIPVSSVRTDNCLAMKELVTYLVCQGKKRIGFITVAENGTSSIKDRRNGFRDALRQTGLEALPECYLTDTGAMNVFSSAADEGQIKEIEQYLDAHTDLDAVICAEYGIARCLGMAEGAERRKELTVCCIDEDYLSPEGIHYTHVKQNEKKIAEEAIRILILMVDKRPEYRQEDCLVPGIFKVK